MQAIAATTQRRLWRRAAAFHLGGGADGGVSMRSARSLVKALRRRGVYDKAAMLECVMCAGAWTRHRRAEAGYTACDLCPRCGLHPETDLHRYWQCSKNSELGGWVARTRHLERQAQELAAESPCFWLRGLLPLSMLPTAPLQPEMQWEVADAIGGARPAPGEVYTDGSGSEADPRLRRCGWAGVHLKRWGSSGSEAWELAGGWMGTLGEGVHAVARAELKAVLEVVRRTSGDLTVH
eukprot:8730402-Alexandrium_andersonii.AAC.1